MGENMKEGTNRLREIMKKNYGKRLENMIKIERASKQRQRERESVLNDHFSSLEAVIWLASGLQVM